MPAGNEEREIQMYLLPVRAAA